MAKAVIFDKDGVIFENKNLYYEMWRKTFSKFNKSLTADFMSRELSGRSAHESIKKHLDPNISDSKLKLLIGEIVEFITGNYQKYVTTVPGVIQFLDGLAKVKVPAAMGTSSRREITEYGLDFFKIRKYFQAVVTVADIKKAKPDPEIFLKAAALLKVDPGDCVVFEDSFSGVEAARSAGMKVVLVMTSHTRKEIPDVDLAIRNFTEIRAKDIKMI